MNGDRIASDLGNTRQTIEAKSLEIQAGRTIRMGSGNKLDKGTYSVPKKIILSKVRTFTCQVKSLIFVRDKLFCNNCDLTFCLKIVSAFEW